MNTISKLIKLLAISLLIALSVIDFIAANFAVVLMFYIPIIAAIALMLLKEIRLKIRGFIVLAQFIKILLFFLFSFLYIGSFIEKSCYLCVNKLYVLTAILILLVLDILIELFVKKRTAKKKATNHAGDLDAQRSKKRT